MEAGDTRCVRTFQILNARVLIVGDQESHVILLQRMLCGPGNTSVDSTMDPTELCELHRKNRYAAILHDLKMPGMDGFQVMECLKEVETDDTAPVLVITAEPGHKLRALRAGARDFVTKPLDLPEVLIRVHNMIEVRLLRLETDLLRAQLADAQKGGIRVN
jgi:CheY-like chemotaxis protein